MSNVHVCLTPCLGTIYIDDQVYMKARVTLVGTDRSVLKILASDTCFIISVSVSAPLKDFHWDWKEMTCLFSVKNNYPNLQVLRCIGSGE